MSVYCSLIHALAPKLHTGYGPRNKSGPIDLLRQVRGGSLLGNGNCEAARSESGTSRELCIVRTVRARKGARWVGVLEYRVPPVLYRGGCPLGMQLCVCILFPYPRISTGNFTLRGFVVALWFVYGRAYLWKRKGQSNRNENTKVGSHPNHWPIPFHALRTMPLKIPSEPKEAI